MGEKLKDSIHIYRAFSFLKANVYKDLLLIDSQIKNFEKVVSLVPFFPAQFFSLSSFLSYFLS